MYFVCIYTNQSHLSTHLKFCKDCCNIWTAESEEGVLNLLQGVKAFSHSGSNVFLSSHRLPVNILGFGNNLLQLLYLFPHLGLHNLDKTKSNERDLLLFYLIHHWQDIEVVLGLTKLTITSCSKAPKRKCIVCMCKTESHAVPAAPEEALSFEAAPESQWLFGGNAPYSPLGPESHSGDS